MINPYQNFEYDPFEIGRLLNLCGASFEAFKKIACAGLDGRKKDKQQDLTEAVYTVERIIRDIEDGAVFQHSQQSISGKISVREIVEMYGESKSNGHKAALTHFLTAHYTHYQCNSHLRACVEKLNLELSGG